jgi:hypothetical protein
MRAMQESEEKTHSVPAFQTLAYQEFDRHGPKTQMPEKIGTQL